MYVCICNAITDKDIRNAVTTTDTATKAGVTALYRRLGCEPQCGECMAYAGELIAYYIERNREDQLANAND